MFTGARLKPEIGYHFWTFALFGSGYAGIGEAFLPVKPAAGQASMPAVMKPMERRPPRPPGF